MHAKNSRIALFAVLSSLLFGVVASAQGQNSLTLDVLAKLVNRAGQPTTTFGEFPELVGAYLAAEVELGRPPTEQDLSSAGDVSQQRLLSVAVDQGVGAAQKEAPTTAQQTGANSNSVGTTTLTEKAGIADLINLAIERGAITKTTSGTSFTLQTTPYMIYSQFGAKDTEEQWTRLAILRQIGISATFNQTEGTDAPTSNNFESGEIKYAIGDRSPRDKQFLDDIRNKLEASFATVDETAKSLLKTPRGQTKKVEIAFTLWLQSQPKPVSPDLILAELKKEFTDNNIVPTLTPGDILSLQDLTKKLDQENRALAAASEVVKAEAKKYLEAPHPQFSLAGSYHRDAVVSDFSVIKGLFAYQTEGRLSANLNAELMINNHRLDSAGHELDRLRAYAFEGSLTLGKFANDALDFTAAAKWERPMGESQDLRSFQAKLNLYLAQGITIPFSLSYTNTTIDPNSTQSTGKSRVRLNVGLSLSGDALMGVARRAQ